MDELLKRIPVSVIAVCVVVLTVLISFAVLRGDKSIDIWGMKIEPRPTTAEGGLVPSMPVGTVVASYLTPQQMKEKYGDEWVLANGDDVSTQTAFYEITGKTKLPDLRGMFIRGLNVHRNDDKQDPEGRDRVVGDFQRDAFERHSHEIKVAGIWGRSFQGESRGPNAVYELRGPTEPTGGFETRPRNIGLYYYIKVR